MDADSKTPEPVRSESGLTATYQTTIPVAVRDALRLAEDDRLRYVEENGRVYIERIDTSEDPRVLAMLDYLDREIDEHPERLVPLTEEYLERTRHLTEGVEVDLDAPLPPDDA